MEEEFVPYYETLELIELGITEEIPCLAFRKKKDGELFINVPEYRENKLTKEFSWRCIEYVEVPTYSQAFKWFREKHSKDSFIARCNSTKEYFFDISWSNKKGLLKDFQSKDFKTHPEAELECLKKLIKITKEKLVVPK